MFERGVRATAPAKPVDAGVPSRQRRTVIQRSLRVGSVHDPAEREADRVAEAVVARRAVAPTQVPVVGAAGGDVPADVGRQIESLRTGGQAIGDHVRAPLERVFARDLSQVRIHTSRADADVSRSIGAQAFTVGHDIFFDRGMYRPTEPGGRHLLAHELAHVVQQGGGRIARSTATIRRAPALKKDSVDEYVDDEIPGATMKATGVPGGVDETEYFIFETGATFAYNSKSAKYLVKGKEVPAAHLKPSSTDALPIVPEVEKDVTPVLAKVPGEEEIRNEYDQKVKQSNGKMTMPFETYLANFLKKSAGKADPTKPFDISSDGALKALWGGKARFTKLERAEAIMKMFTAAGFKVANFEVSAKSSAKSNPPALFDVVGHPTVKSFEIHPGGGIHGAMYIRIQNVGKVIKIFNTKLPEVYERLGQQAREIDVAITP